MQDRTPSSLRWRLVDLSSKYVNVVEVEGERWLFASQNCKCQSILSQKTRSQPTAKIPESFAKTTPYTFHASRLWLARLEKVSGIRLTGDTGQIMRHEHESTKALFSAHHPFM